MAKTNEDILHKTLMVSFNCKSVKRSIDGVRQMCAFADIVALQETWLLSHDIPTFLDSIDDNFGSTGTTAVDTSAGLLKGRPYGGVALLWRKSMFPCVSVISCDNPRIAVIKITMDSRSILVFSVYMPTNDREKLHIFTDCLSAIRAIIEDNSVESVLMLGDFNAHPHELFCNELLDYMSEQNWFCADFDKLGISSDTYTFISEAHNSMRWLDHYIVTKAAFKLVTNIYVMYDVYWSDHFPLVIECNLNLIRQKNVVGNSLSSKIM